MSFWKFYSSVVEMAFSGKFWFAEKISGVFALFFGALVFAIGKWESAVNWVPFLVGAIVFAGTVLLGLFIAPYRLFREENVGRALLSKELVGAQQRTARAERDLDDLRRCDFSLSPFDSIVIDVCPNGSQILIHLAAQNTGAPGAILAHTWQMKIETTSGVSSTGIPITISPTVGYQIPIGINPTHFFKYVREDGLDLRASSIVARMGYVSGVLMFAFPDVSYAQLVDDQTKLEMLFTDVSNRQYQKTFRNADLKANSDFIFKPGLSNPHALPIAQMSPSA
jgi:hypothetical protein